MKAIFWRKWLRPLLFILGGVLAGLGYYYSADCATGSCLITSSPVWTALYMGLLGWLISGVVGKGCEEACNT